MISEYIYLYRGKKATLEELNYIYKKFVLIVELEDGWNGSKRDLLGKMCKWKMGDGITPYKDLPYQDGLIPVAFRLRADERKYKNEEM